MDKLIKTELSIIILIVFIVQSFSQTIESTSSFPQVSLENTEVRTLHSSIVGQDYELWVSLPSNYHSTNNLYPVILLLDPYRSFSILKGYTDVLTFPHSIIPEAIIVGIGYGGKGFQAKLNWVLGRIRDLTPTVDPETENLLEKSIMAFGIKDVKVKTGGAELFLKFIGKELLPYIESNYRIDPHQRILSGYSFGGLFCLFTLFHNPNLFSGYLVGSPSIRYNDGIILDYEYNYSKTHTDLSADVFISAGELETTSEDVRKIDELLRSRNYENLNLRTVIFENEDHVTCMSAAISRGIVKLLKKENTK